MSDVNTKAEPQVDIPGRPVQRGRLRTLTAAAGVLVVVAGAVVGTWLLVRHRAEQEAQTAQVVNQALGEANALRAAGRWHDALAAAERGVQALDGSVATDETRAAAQALLEELRPQAADADKDRRMLEQLDRARDLLCDVQEADILRAAGRSILMGHAAVDAYAGAFREYGIDVAMLPTEEAGKRIGQRRIRPQLCAALDCWHFAEPNAAGGRLLEIAAAADPDTPASQVRRAIARKEGAALKALAEGAQAIDLPASTLILLVEELHGAGKRAAGIDILQRARRKHADDFWLQHSAGVYLAAGPRSGWGEAGRAFTAAIALVPTNAGAWRNLGVLLIRDGQLDAAAVAMEKSIELNPNAVMSHGHLADAMRRKGRSAEALATVDKAIARHPNSAMLHATRGDILRGMNRKDDAAAAYQQALAEQPQWYPAHLGLAAWHAEKGETGKAMALLQHVEREHSKDPEVQVARWQILLKLRGQEKAVAPAGTNDGLTRLQLARALQRKGEFAEAHRAFTQAVQDLDPLTVTRLAAASELKHCERLLALDKQLEDFRARGALPKSTKEVFAMAEIARQYQQNYFTAANLYGRIFTPEAKLVDELIGDHRYRAACCAVLAATGKARDLPKATASQKGHMRDQALRWLHAELDECTQAARAGKSEDTPRLIDRIARWKTDPDLQAIRPKSLDALPADEQTAWRELWDDAELFVKAIRTGMLQITLQGSLSPTARAQDHEIQLVGGRVYVIDLESSAFDPQLKLHDAAGKVLAENDDAGSTNRNARVVFTAPADGVYRLVATSYRETGTGAYRLRIAALKDSK